MGDFRASGSAKFDVDNIVGRGAKANEREMYASDNIDPRIFMVESVVVRLEWHSKSGGKDCRGGLNR